jgi:hypothetical protein
MKKILLIQILVLIILAIACKKSVNSPEPAKFELLGKVYPENSGNVSQNSGFFTSGTELNLSANPAEGYVFKEWQGDIVGSENPLKVKILKNINYTAVFVKKNYELNVKIVGSGVVNESIVPASTTTKAVYDHGTNVKLTAVPMNGWEFVGWSGDEVGVKNPIVVNVVQKKNVSANFAPIGDVKIKFSGSDYNDLTNSLKVLMKGWSQTDVERANTLFTKYSYLKKEEWAIYFKTFFTENPLSDDLRNYLVYPTFYWLSDEVRQNLQWGVLEGLIHQSTLLFNNTTLFSNIYDVRKTNFNPHRMIGDYFLLSDKVFSGNLLYEKIYQFYSGLFESQSVILHADKPLAGETLNLYGPLKTQVFCNLAGLVKLNPKYKSQVQSLINLGSTKESTSKLFLWNTYGLLISDNEFLNSTTLDLSKKVLNVVDNNYHQVIHFSTSAMSQLYPIGHISGFNVFSVNFGQQNENGFPSDFPPFPSDFYYLVFVHELNHNVDVYFLNKNERLRNYKNTILKLAGVNKENYLRNMFENGFFQNSPQEFFASISNMYFSNSIKTLEVAIKRYQGGNKNQINQFLLFANVYSDNTKVKFFESSLLLPFSVKEYQIIKDNEGFITKLFIEGKNYEFTLNNDKTVNTIKVN